MSITAWREQGASPGSRTVQARAPAAGFAPACAEATWLAMLLAAPAAMNLIAPRVFEAAKLAALAPLAALLVAACACALWQRRLERAIDGRPAPAAPGAIGPPPRSVAVAFAALLACALLATLASENLPVAWLGSYFRREGMAAWLVAALPGAAMLFLLRNMGQLRRALDAVLLACVLPCAYALMQRYGLVPEPGGMLLPIARPGGTLGNPVFLGDFAMLLIPLTAARLFGAAGWRARAPFALLLLLQAWTLLATQSRAPLAALLFALWLFAMLVAGLHRSRRAALLASVPVAAAVLAVLLINVVPAVGTSLRDVPLLGRLVLASGDASGAARLGIWQAGWDTLRSAPVGRQLFGYGFDVAQGHYFAHVPAGVLAIEGDGDLTDRLHNEVLELWAGMGLCGLAAYLAWLALLLRAAHDALAGVRAESQRPWSRHAFWIAPIAAGLAAAAGATAAGWAQLAGIAAGTAAGAVWVPMLALPVWRRAPTGRPGEREWLVAALAATVVAFWLDAQLSLPVMSTRMVFFTLAALLALLAGTPAPLPADRDRPREDALVLGWMAGILMIVALVAFCPAPFGLIYAVPQAQGAARALLLAAPLAALLAAAAWCLPRGARGDGVYAAGMAALLCALPPAAGYAALAALWPAWRPGSPEEALGAPVLWMWVGLCASCVGLAWWRARRAALPEPAGPGRKDKVKAVQPRAGAARGAAVLLACALPLAAWLAWDELRADSLARLAGRAWDQGDFDTAAARTLRAAELRPGERQYRATLGAWRLERVLAQLQKARGGRAEDYLHLAGELRAAEADLRAALALAPDDPRALASLANVLQFKGMTAMRPLIGDAEGTAAAREARGLFARAHGLYPAQAGILVNWAQLEFDAGDARAAYRLLDRAEGLQPRNGSPYLERLRMARFAGDRSQEDATWQRARRSLPAATLNDLERALAPGTP
jgi:O-antigen ligase/tetratricopeptide (TPR) repeat protein